MKLNIKAKIVLALSLFIQVSAFAQLNEIEFENYNTADGLASFWSLSPIVQDKDGYIWLLSLEGLNRFDGYEFKVYQHNPNDSTSLISNFPQNLFVDSKNRFWVVTNFDSIGILSLYNSETDNFTHFRNFKNSNGQFISFDEINSLQEDTSGFLWFSSGVKLHVLDPNTMIVKDIINEEKLVSSLHNKNIDGFFLDSNQNFWVRDNGNFIKYNPILDSVDVFKFIGEYSGFVNPYEDIDGVIFFGGRNSCLNMYDPSSNSLVKLPTQSGKYKLLQPAISKGPLYDADGMITILKRTTKGNLWIGTVNGGIKVFNKNLTQFKYYSADAENNKNLGLSFTSNLFEDNQENLWIPTFNQGLLKVVPSRSIFTLSGNGLAALEDANSHSIRGIYESKDRTIWIGTADGVILTYNPISKKKQLFESKSNNSKNKNRPTGGDYQAFYEDPDGIMWIASFNGINKYDRKNGIFSKAVFNLENHASESTQDIESIIPDEDDDYVWIGTWGDGIFKHNRKTLQTINYKSLSDSAGLLSNRIWTMLQTRSGEICVGTPNGLSILNKSTNTFQNYLIGIAVNTIYEDYQSNLWLGTRQGLYKLSPQKEIIKRYTKNDGFPSNMIGGILCDDNNILWIGTGRGIVRLNPKDESVLVFDDEDGVRIDLFETANSFFKTQDGLLLFGSSSKTGITAFHPDNIQYNKYPPNVLITDMSVFDNVKDTLISIRNKRSEGHNKIELSYSQNDIIFNYVGIHFRNPKRNKYKYRLEPYDNDWKNDGILRSARYTNLDPGEYTFKVIAANSDGVWSKKYASINISILPPWWKTYWAYSFYILFVIGLLYSVRKFELNRQKKNTEIKESKLKAEAAESQAKAAEAQAKVIQAENERKTKELEEARQLQLSMLPKTIPSLPYLDIAVYMKTATEVGGDYYDFNVGLDGTLTVAIGDATGHGMQAGTIVSMAKALFASGSSKLDMKTYFNQSSDALKQIELGRLMMAFMMIKIYDHKLEICNAGMPPLFIYRKQSKQVEEIMLKGMPLGALKNFPYEIIKTEISTGDTFLLLSDGLPELKNKSNNQYGYERVRESFGRTAEKQPEEIITYLKNEDSQWINDKEPDDDITFVVIKVK